MSSRLQQSERRGLIALASIIALMLAIMALVFFLRTSGNDEPESLRDSIIVKEIATEENDSSVALSRKKKNKRKKSAKSSKRKSKESPPAPAIDLLSDTIGWE